MLRQHSWLWLTGYAFLYLLRPTCHPFPIGFRAPLRFRAQNRCERPHLFRQFSGLRQIKPQYGDPQRFQLPFQFRAWVCFPCKDNVRAKFSDHFEIRHEAAPYAWQSRHFRKLCLSGLRVLRDSDERVYSLHNPDTFDAGSGERHDSANRNGNMDASSQGIRNDGFRTLCPSRRTHRQNKNGEPSQNAVHNISLSVRTSVSASSSSRCIYSASKPSESVFAIANWTRPCRSTSITKE